MSLRSRLWLLLRLAGPAVGCVGFEELPDPPTVTAPRALVVEVAREPGPEGAYEGADTLRLRLSRAGVVPDETCAETRTLCLAPAGGEVATPEGLCAGWYAVEAALVGAGACDEAETAVGGSDAGAVACALAEGDGAYFFGLDAPPLSLRCVPTTSLHFDVVLL